MAVSQAIIFLFKSYSILHFVVCQLLRWPFLSSFYAFPPTAWEMFLPSGRMLVRSFVCSTVCPCILHETCTLTRYLGLPIFIPIVNVLDLHFKVQHFKSSTLGCSNVIISQTVTDRTNIAIVNTGCRMWHSYWHIYIWPWPIVKVKVNGMHISTVTNGDRYGKHCFFQQIESRVRPFNWHICIAYWTILNVKVRPISIANFTQVVSAKANIAIAIK